MNYKIIVNPPRQGMGAQAVPLIREAWTLRAAL